MRIWVYAEARDGVPTKATAELVNGARAVGREVVAFGAGPGAWVSDIAPAAASGADLILFPTSFDGREAAGRLSARLNRPVIANGVGLSVSGEEVIVETAILGGTTIVRTAFRGPRPWLATFRPGSFDRGDLSMPEMITVEPTPGRRAPRIVARHEEDRRGQGPALEEARVVVAGGRGLGSAENFTLVEELARLLGGAPAATRAAVDAGWAPYAWQVGQTGKTVAPTVYLAFGVSGAAQHLVGMTGAAHLVAVNSDRSAPVFSVSDLAVVGDAKAVLPALIEAVRSRLS